MNRNCEVKRQALSSFRIFSSCPYYSKSSHLFSQNQLFLLFGSQQVLPNSLLIVQRFKKTQRGAYLVFRAVRQSQVRLGGWRTQEIKDRVLAVLSALTGESEKLKNARTFLLWVVKSEKSLTLLILTTQMAYKLNENTILLIS